MADNSKRALDQMSPGIRTSPGKRYACEYEIPEQSIKVPGKIAKSKYSDYQFDDNKYTGHPNRQAPNKDKDA